MAVNLRVLDKLRHEAITPHRVVPVRFARAVDGFSDLAAPDLDDHGFVLPTNFCQARGPVVGVMQSSEIRIKAMRDRVENAAQLFATTDDATVASVEFPAAGTALNTADLPGPPARPADCVFVKGQGTGAADRETKIKIRFGAADGPVLAETAVRVYQKITINVQAHSVSINGVGPTTNFATIQGLFERVNRIYAQAGVEFVLQGALMNEAVVGFARAGTVTLTAVADQQNTELQTVLRQNAAAGMLNAYLIPHYFDTVSGLADQVLGIAFSTDDVNGNPPNAATGFPGCQAGITYRDSPDPIEASHTIAHEIGHSLQLQHYALGNGSNNSANDQREDIWAHRCLMYNIVGLVPGTPAGNRFRSSAARIEVGYGDLASGIPCTGQLLTTKERQGLQQSSQVDVLRQAARAGTCFPV